jgi:hypothetical protein
MEEINLAAYKKARKRVKKIKGFYRHLTIYLIANAIIVIEGFWGISVLELSSGEIDPQLIEWLFLNVLSVPILWGIGLLLHGLSVFRPKIGIIKDWEEKQLQKFLEEEYKKENFI